MLFPQKGAKKPVKNELCFVIGKNKKTYRLCFIKKYYFKSKDVQPVFVTKVKNVH